MINDESAEYGACAFELNGRSVIFRVAKITPTKVGQFVTLWKRVGSGPIQPYDVTDSIDLIVINTRNKDYFGQFVFPQAVLCEKDIVSINQIGGKRGVRVYPPWNKAVSQQAQKTQEWQLHYFLDMSVNSAIDYRRARILYAGN